MINFKTNWNFLSDFQDFSFPDSLRLGRGEVYNLYNYIYIYEVRIPGIRVLHHQLVLKLMVVVTSMITIVDPLIDEIIVHFNYMI